MLTGEIFRVVVPASDPWHASDAALVEFGATWVQGTYVASGVGSDYMEIVLAVGRCDHCIRKVSEPVDDYYCSAKCSRLSAARRLATHRGNNGRS